MGRGRHFSTGSPSAASWRSYDWTVRALWLPIFCCPPRFLCSSPAPSFTWHRHGTRTTTRRCRGSEQQCPRRAFAPWPFRPATAWCRVRRRRWQEMGAAGTAAKINKGPVMVATVLPNGQMSTWRAQPLCSGFSTAQGRSACSRSIRRRPLCCHQARRYSACVSDGGRHGSFIGYRSVARRAHDVDLVSALP